jgi:ABC-type transport system involved in cytochrome c biogenesis permease subunit
MFSGVTIVCFAASYAMTLALEITRLVLRSRIRGAVMLGFAGAGLFAHSTYLYYRAIHAIGPPLSSERDWYLLAAWVLAAVYLYLTYYHPRTAFGLFVLPLVLGLIGVAAFLADSKPFPQAPASKVWGFVHGVSLLLTTVAVFVGFAAGLMYLAQARRLKRKLPPRRGLRLPSLEWLQRVNSRALVVSLLMLGVGVLSGVLLDLVNHSGRLPFRDPVVLSSVFMFAWMAVSVGMGVVYRPAREGPRLPT